MGLACSLVPRAQLPSSSPACRISYAGGSFELHHGLCRWSEGGGREATCFYTWCSSLDGHSDLQFELHEP